MSTKTVNQSFVTDWTKLQSWAQSQNIPKSALLPVFQLDSQRLLNGDPMSESERYRAVLASAGLNYSTSIPTDNPSPSNIIGNTQHNLEQIFTGLDPIGLIKNAYDSIKNTLEHPLTTIKDLTTSAGLKTLANHPTRSLASWIPGITDLGDLLTSKKGINYLAENPVSAILDVSSLAKIGDLALVGETGEQIANRLGTTVTVLKSVEGLKGIKALARLTGTLSNPFAKQLSIGVDDAGNTIFAKATITDTLKSWARSHHIGPEAGNLMYGAATIGQAQTKIAQELLQPLDKAMRELDVPQREQVVNLLEQSGRSYDDILNDPSITINVRSAIQAYEPIENWLQQQALSTGKVTSIRMPDGRMELYTSRVGARVQARIDKIDKAQQDFEDQAKKVNLIDARSKQIDSHTDYSLLKLTTLRNTIWNYLSDKSPRDQTDLEEASTGDISDIVNKTKIRRLTKTEDHRFDNPNVRRMLGLSDEPIYALGEKAVTKSNLNIINNILRPGGVIDDMLKARADKNFVLYRDLAYKTQRWMSGKFAQEISLKDAPDAFNQLRSMINDIYSTSKERVQLEKQFHEAYTGITVKGKRESLTKKIERYQRAQKEFENYVWTKPPTVHEFNAPDSYRPLFLEIYAKKLAEHEDKETVLQGAVEELRQKGFTEEQLNNLRSNPQTIFELVGQFATATFTDPLIGKAYGDIRAQVVNSALKEVKSLRAQGFIPHYVPSITPHEMPSSGIGSYNIFIHTDRVPSISQAFNRTWDFGSTTFNFMAAVTHAAKEQLTRDGTLDFMNNYAMPLTYDYNNVLDAILREPEYQARLADVTDPDARGAIITRILTENGLVRWDPDELFAVKLPRPTNREGQLLMPKGVADTLESVVKKGQYPMTGLWDKATNLFRFSILGLSPRFTAHIVFGGTYLLALRINPLTFRFLGDAYKATKGGIIPDEVFSNLTEEGSADIAFHYMAGRTATRLALEEKLVEKGINPKAAAMVTWIKSAMEINYRFTRVVGNMQRALAFIDGASKVEKLGYIIDQDGNKVLNISSEKAIDEGMKSVLHVMGDTRRMSPFERNIVTKILPFYGWTKHVLTYVLTYPVDHPIRAQILAGIAENNTLDVPDGLPMRIQLLFFLGSPTATGTVKALTVRALSPLRTMANYASLSGWISGLNPVITAPFATIDPSITFGSNTLYPTISFNDVFGVEQANPASSVGLAGIEQIVPQVSAIQAALGIGSQYRNLKKTDPTAFKKEIFESLNIPFLNVQHINTRQIAAKDEIDRYDQAKAAATTAFSTGTFTILKGYGKVPYPINTVYNVSPAQLQAMYQASMAEYGEPPGDVLPYVYSPSNL